MKNIRLKVARVELGMSQEDLAKQWGNPSDYRCHRKWKL